MIGRLARISRLQGPVVDWVVVGPVCLLAGARRGQLPGALGCLDPSKERLVPASCACISCRTKARGEVWPLVLWVAHSSREQGEAPAAGLLLSAVIPSGRGPLELAVPEFLCCSEISLRFFAAELGIDIPP